MSTEEIRDELKALAEKFNPESPANKEHLRQLSIAGPAWRNMRAGRLRALEQFHKAVTELIARIPAPEPAKSSVWQLLRRMTKRRFSEAAFLKTQYELRQLLKQASVAAEPRVNYAALIDPEQEYPVSYAYHHQQRGRVAAPESGMMLGKDLTAPQIKELHANVIV